MVVNIYLSPPPYPLRPGADFHIGVEKGAIYALTSGQALDLIIGDFDSLTPAQIKMLENADIPLLKYPAEKALTDAELALKEALKKDPETIYIHTSSGPRIDHLYANLRNLIPGQSFLIGPTFKAYRLAPGTHTIAPELPYCSIFALTPTHALEITGFKYQGFFQQLVPEDVQGISNQGQGQITFTKGDVLIIESKD